MAAGGRDEVDVAEAGGAKPAWSIDRGVAGEALRRQQHIKRSPSPTPCDLDDAAHRGSLKPRALGTKPIRRHIGVVNVPPQIFDRDTLRRRRDRAAGSVSLVEPVLREVAERLLDRLDDVTRTFTQALDVGGRGVVAPMLRARGISTVSCDLSAAMAARSGGPAVAADEEALPFAAESFDLVVANLSLHAINDLPGALIQLRRALRPDGLFLASLPALGTLAELRAALTETELALSGGASPRVAPFPDLRDGAALLQRAGFALPVADVENMTLHYATPFALLRDLRAAGEANVITQRSRVTPSKALFPRALAAMPSSAGHLVCTLRLAILTGWAPSPSQPRPLQPGSAQHSLADALGDPGRLSRR